jgi:hypothetical protein
MTEWGSYQESLMLPLVTATLDLGLHGVFPRRHEALVRRRKRTCLACRAVPYDAVALHDRLLLLRPRGPLTLGPAYVRQVVLECRTHLPDGGVQERMPEHETVGGGVDHPALDMHDIPGAQFLHIPRLDLFGHTRTSRARHVVGAHAQRV